MNVTFTVEQLCTICELVSDERDVIGTLLAEEPDESNVKQLQIQYKDINDLFNAVNDALMG